MSVTRVGYGALGKKRQCPPKTCLIIQMVTRVPGKPSRPR